MTFEEHLKKYLTGFWDKPKVRLKGNEKKLSVEEQSFILLERGLDAGLNKKVESALKDYGIPVVREVIRFTNKDLKIVEAKTEDGRTVLASPNPFQADVQAFIYEQDMVTKSRTFETEEPAWLRAPVLETLDSIPEPVIPSEPEVETAVPQAQKTSIFTAQPTKEVEEGPPESGETVSEPEMKLPVDYAALALAQEQTESTAAKNALKQNPEQTGETPEVPIPAPALVSTPATAPSEPQVPASTEAQPVPQVQPAAQPQPAPVHNQPEIQTPVPPTTDQEPKKQDQPLQRFISQNSEAPKKANLTARRKKPEIITIGQALIELGIEFDMNELNNPNIDIKLRREGFISETQQYRAKALAHTLPFVDVTLNPPKAEVLNLLDEHTTRTEHAFPYSQEGETFVVLTDTPARESLIRNKIIERTGFKHVEVRVTDPSTFVRLITEAYTATNVTREMHETLESRTQGITADLSTTADNAVSRYVQTAIITGVNNRASDIHFEQSAQGLQIRYRIDKHLTTLDTEPIAPNLAGNIIRVIKNMSGMDPNNNRVPQDNNIHLKLDANRTINLRVSTLPQHDGMEKVVIRLLKEAAEIPEIEKLNLSGRNLEKFKRMISQPEGIILVTGPTGSGKSFTLYAALKRIATPERNVQTIEDPIEYQLPGINQAQINPAQQFTFASALRSTMRQDPDVILVGEIRDVETAEAAIAAANTGHLVLSTLHTNDAASAIQRLRNLEVKDYNIEPSIRGILAQRLVRRVCKECARSVPAPDYFRKIVSEMTEDVPETILEASDEPCPSCNQGYRGMVPIHELLVITPHLRQLIGEGATTEQLLQEANKHGHVSLQQDAFLKVAQGLTTLKEVTKAISFQEDTE